MVFLHSGVGSAGEWREAFSLWPDGHRLIAVDAYRDGSGPGVPGHRTLDNYVGQVHVVTEHVGQPVHLIGFSWGGATALHMAATAPALLASLAVVEPEAYSLFKAEDGPAFAAICRLRDQWREHVRAGGWYEAFEVFVDFTTALAPLPGGGLPGVTRSLTTSARKATCGTSSSKLPSPSAGWRR